MTHEEIINHLSEIIWKNENDAMQVSKEFFKENLQYAINQLKQCEVFDEPKEMAVSNINGSSVVRNVVGKFKGLFLAVDVVNRNGVVSWDVAKEIKKEPISFDLWYDKNYIQKGFSASIHYQQIEDFKNKYTEYLKQFNEK